MSGESTLDIYNSTIWHGTATGGIGGNIYAIGSAIVNMYSGLISEGKANARGGNVYVTGNASFNLYGGTVEDGKSTLGDNLYAYASTSSPSLNIYGGYVGADKEKSGDPRALYANKAGAVLNIYGGSFYYIPNGTDPVATKWTGTNYQNATRNVYCTVVDDGDADTKTGFLTEHPEAVAGTPVAATCVEPGYTPYSCEHCNQTWKAYSGNGAGHTEQVVSGKAATCTEKGLTDGKVCATCGVVLAGQTTIKKLGHDKVVDVEAVAATCTEPGKTEGSHCSRCDGATVTSEEIPALGHTAGEPVVENAQEGSCTVGATYESVVYCTVCEAEISRTPVTETAPGHTEQSVSGKAATCTEDGLTDGKKCSVCGVTLVEQEEIKANGHTYGAVVTAPTCDAAGYTTYTCSVCGDSYTADEVTATGHTEETVEGYAATCTEAGLTDGKQCSVCGVILVEQEEIKALGHTEETVSGKDATCSEPGLTDGKKCSVCGVTLEAQTETPTIPHTEETVTGTAATCTATGLTEGSKCSVCGVTITAQEEIPILEHDMDEGVYTEATFEANAYTTYTCQYGCGHFEVITHENTMLTAVAQNGETLYTDLEAALNQGGTVTLLTDLALQKVLRINKGVEVTLDLGGKTLTTYAVNDNYDVVVNGALTIEGEGQVLVSGVYGIGVATSGELTVNGGTFTVDEKNDYLIGSWGKVEITGGTFNGVYNCVNSFAGSATVSGGDFTTGQTSYDGECEAFDLLGENVVVSGGTFSKEVASEYLVEGLICAQTDAGRYEVRAPKELTITQQPAAQEKKAGETFTISTEVEGDGELTYLWLYKRPNLDKWMYWAEPTKGLNEITGAATMARDGYQFKCVITDTYGNTAETEVATLTVAADETAIALEACAEVISATAGDNVVLTATTEKVEGLKYLWLYQRPNTESWYYWTNDSTNTITVSATMARDGYRFKCVVTDASGNSATWGATKLDVEEKSLSTNTMADQTVAVGGQFTLCAGEKDESLTYLWLYKRPNLDKWMYWAEPAKGLNEITGAATASRNGYQFKCRISDAYGTVVETNVITLNVTK